MSERYNIEFILGQCLITGRNSLTFYDTEERAVGRWIDGKTIYRSMFIQPTFPLTITNLNIDEFLWATAIHYQDAGTSEYFLPGSPCYADGITNIGIYYTSEGGGVLRREGHTGYPCK